MKLIKSIVRKCREADECDCVVRRCGTLVSGSLAAGVCRAERLSGCLLEKMGDGWRSGGVCPNALRPLCWLNSCWYATGLMECGNGNDGLQQKKTLTFNPVCTCSVARVTVFWASFIMYRGRLKFIYRLIGDFSVCISLYEDMNTWSSSSEPPRVTSGLFTISFEKLDNKREEIF